MIDAFTTLLRRAFTDVHTRVFGSQAVFHDEESDILRADNVDGVAECVLVTYHREPEIDGMMADDDTIAEFLPFAQPRMIEAEGMVIAVSYAYTIYPTRALFLQRADFAGANQPPTETAMIFAVAKLYGAIWHEIRHQVQLSDLVKQDQWKKDLEFVSREPIHGISDLHGLIAGIEHAIGEAALVYRDTYQGTSGLALRLECEMDAMCVAAASILEWVRMSVISTPHDEKMDRIAELLRS